MFSKWKHNAFGGNLEKTIDVEALHPGTYLVEVVGEGRSVGRFVKE